VRPAHGTRVSVRPPVLPDPVRERFLATDRYRVGREWQRYDGTAQRDLFRILRERFLARHAPVVSRALDVGSGPGRFTARLAAGPSTRRVALDIARAMLTEIPDRWAGVAPGVPLPDRVQGDGAHLPFLDGSFGLVAALGNLLGFAGGASDRLVEQLVGALAPEGTLLLEIAPGPGERSRYLRRLPPTSVARLLRSTPRVVAARIAREGFVEEPRRRKVPGEFRRVDPRLLHERLRSWGFQVEETVAVAPALGPDGVRAQAAANDLKAWSHLLEVEETLGRAPERWSAAAAVLVAAVRRDSPENRSGAPVSKSEG
jgi:SAM-dependent methyltransferase